MGEAAGPAEIEALQRELKRVADISAARVVVAPDGTIAEVHIISSSRRHPKQIVRDVESVALAEFGLDIDRRVVSVVQFDRAEDAAGYGDYDDRDEDGQQDGERDEPEAAEDGATAGAATVDLAAEEERAAPAAEEERETVVEERAIAAEERRIAAEPETPERIDGSSSKASPEPRYVVDSVSVQRTMQEYRVTVGLRRSGSYVSGTAVGFPVEPSTIRTAAEATLDALRKLDRAPEHLALDRVVLLPVDGMRLALATVVLVASPIEEILAGTAVVCPGRESEAVVRAVLDATNRRLALVG